MFKRVALGLLTLGCLAAAWTGKSYGFGEPRVVPDTSYYFDNWRFDRYPYATVVGVLNGDTIVAQIDGEQTLRKVRLAGIQAPLPDEQPYSRQAVELLKSKIQFQVVKLEGDKLLRDEDATDLVEAYVWLHGEQINAVLVRNGLATVVPYSHNIKYDNYFSGLQTRARDENLGIWATLQ
ncbi:MAG: thermonuclease family protein [Cyanobacteriota bacterium]|nr:thermonuclease family protein [Cyanobacteriota bacterium]